MIDDPFSFHANLRPVAYEDVRLVLEKDRSYGSSWKKRGGVGAFMMLARKWDRLEAILVGRFGYNLFDAIESQASCQGDDGTVLAEVRDLRRYLLLVEAEMIERGVVPVPVHTDAPAAPVPATEENHYAERVPVPLALRNDTFRRYPPDLNATGLAELPPRLRGIYEWDDDRAEYVMKPEHREEFAVGYGEDATHAGTSHTQDK